MILNDWLRLPILWIIVVIANTFTLSLSLSPSTSWSSIYSQHMSIYLSVLSDSSVQSTMMIWSHLFKTPLEIGEDTFAILYVIWMCTKDGNQLPMGMIPTMSESDTFHQRSFQYQLGDWHMSPFHHERDIPKQINDSVSTCDSRSLFILVSIDSLSEYVFVFVRFEGVWG
jgi:hypothetical protein